MSGKTVNAIIAVCVIAMTASYFYWLYKSDQRSNDFENKLLKEYNESKTDSPE